MMQSSTTPRNAGAQEDSQAVDHRAFLKSLPSETRQALTERSDGPGLRQLALHWGAIAGLGALIAMQVPGWPLLLAPQGVLIVFLFTLLHETVHDTPFKSLWLNRCVGAVSGVLLVLPPLWFRFFHLAHHRHTQDPERDPELAEPKPESWGQYAWHLSGLPVWRSHLATLIRNAAGRCADEFAPPSKRAGVAREARWMMALYLGIGALSLSFGRIEAVTVWLLPAVLGQPFLRLYLLAEHGRCPEVANMFENTRTTFTSRIIRNLAWNMPYHAEHHAYPTVPFHQLPALHQLTAPHLQETEDGYRAFHGKYVREF